ncbi:disulfide bond formation protein DsbA [Microbacterium laevaniformans]|jgi:protein-disulfide isomerase|uniref:DSBA-like thioredoxin domain protein n=1 Tax=Microbacterium laevaniformans TaxID=36807 RepID=A0A150HI97_9MICO|nr:MULTISPECIES: thioredoxin domain-containing protein [Microbacterium]EIC06462.1 DSBA oxidoreductase [Microbacterium laevaniformans OR221]KXZ61791.1 DSBA-like thioredoxin domain protein [Microbacterium laevaniformans]MBN9223688.1 thioredoxin domain-containing protein [Microbacterium sp.]ODT28915.1 MAG: disulfide bond formation protein DsbA [Microbacterium sp. SCN 70-27]TGY36177.1 disulfide bond formation protein DsbA [Microbacterium laevaniformans]
MKTPVKATLVTIAVVVVLVVAALIYVLVNQSQAAPPSSGDGSSSAQLVRENSHVLDDGGEGAVTVVEFLDFECEACGSFYPIVEDLREQFAGEITYVVRYFPLPGHFNSKNAAIAAEAAAQQDRFEDMYHRLFESQAEWGEAQESRADLFRGFAEELGLDMVAYDAAVADPSTTERVDQDFEEGRALGVSSTPTFFVDGELAQLQEWDDLENLVQAAVSGGQ